jgi:N utilization substance protein B
MALENITSVSASVSRLYAIQAVYQLDFIENDKSNIDYDTLSAFFEEYYIEGDLRVLAYAEPDIFLFRKIFSGIVIDKGKLDGWIADSLMEEWPIDRIDPTLKAIFRCFGFEVSVLEGMTLGELVREYIGITQAFFPYQKDVVKFVNGVVDTMAHCIRSEAEKSNT